MRAAGASKDGPTPEELLATWEEVYKKGLLSFWILLLLAEEPRYAYDLAGSIQEASGGTISADENSIYRALNRFEDVGILRSQVRDSDIGPNRRYYSLSPKGWALLRRFVERNILVFEKPSVRKRITDVMSAGRKIERQA